MLSIHPWVRLAAALLLAASAFVAWRPLELLVVYAVVIAGVAAAEIARQHVRFVVGVTLPLLFALLIIWGLLVKPPASMHLGGISYAVAIWLRIAAIGGVFQWLLLPLAERPIHFRSFLASLHLSGTLGTLLITPILFLPEVRRRMARIMDARKAQGLPATGIAGVRALPSMLTPLVSSLMESSLARAELWSHRGLLARDRARWERLPYSPTRSALVAIVAFAVFSVSYHGWR